VTRKRPVVRTERGLDRLVTFLDAIVAIAITLLVLPLVDVLASADEDADLGPVLAEEAAQFGTFVLSFVVIARLWLVHHRLVETVGGYDEAFVMVNLAWSCTVVLLPFATQVMARFGTDRVAVATYIGTITASSVCLSVMSVLVWRRPHLRKTPADAPPRPVAGLVTTGTLVAALVLGVLVPAVNYFALFLLFLTGPVVRRLRRAVE
jgi:TMEM175 potassium channel family protein